MSASKKKSKSSSSRSRPGGGSRPKSQVKLLKEALDLQEATIETLEEQIKERDMSIKSLQMQMEQLQRRLYGPKSDRPGDEAQLLLDDIMGSLQDAEGKQDGEEEAEDDEESDPIKRKKRAKPTGRRMFPDYMERVVEEMDLSDEEKIDPETGCVMAFIGWETRERLERIRKAIDTLPEAYRLPVILRHLQESSYDEIAAFTGQSRDEVRGVLQRAGRQLRQILTEDNEDRGEAEWPHART